VKQENGLSVTPYADDDVSYNRDIQSGYDGFTISIKNHKDSEIYVVWAKTFYVTRGKSYGYFYSNGDSFSTVDKPKPDDVVFANSTFSKNIFPSKLVKYDAGSWWCRPLCARNKYYSGTMPAGVNGIHLTVRLPTGEAHNTLLLTLVPSKQRHLHGG
jgi:hypothetical protein